MSTRAHDNPQRQSPPPARPGSFRAGFAFGVLSFLSVTLLSVGSAIIASRLYGVRIVGQFALVSAPVVAMWVLSTAKEQAALIKEITSLPPRDPRVTQLFAAVFTFSSTLTVVMSTLAAIASWLVFRGPLHQPELVVPTFVSLAGYAVVTNTGWNIDSVLSAFVAGKQLFWVRLHEVISFIVIALAIGLTWRSVWGLVIATIGSSLTALVHRAIVVRPFIRTRLSVPEYRVGLRSLPDLLRFGLKITPGSIAQGVSLQAGVWAVGTVAPVAIVGAYSRAQMIPQRFQQVNERIVEVLYPTLVGRRARGDHHGFDRALIDSIRYGLAGMLLLAAICGGSAHSILQIFGPGFALATPALALLMLYPVMSLMTATLTQALFAVDRPGVTSFVGVARLVVTITLILVLTPSMHITGPALALLAGFAVDLVWRATVLAPSLSRPLAQIWPVRERIALVVAYGAGFAISHLVEHVHSGTGWLLVSLSAGTVAYAIAFYASGGINHRDRHRLIEVLRARYAMRKNRLSSRNTQSEITEAVITKDQALDIHEQIPNVPSANISAASTNISAGPIE